MDGTKIGKFYGDPYGQYISTLLTVGKLRGIDYSIPYNQLNDRAKSIAMEGCGEELFEVEWTYKRGTREGVHHLKTQWPGFLKLVEIEYERKHTDARGEAMLQLMQKMECPHCHGYRLKSKMLSYTLNRLHIGEVTAMSSDEAGGWFTEFFEVNFSDRPEREVALAFREPITQRLDALKLAGLDYLATNRIVGTLSGGEFQRLQLAGLVRAPLSGVAYILDEPSFGLHPKNVQLISDLIIRLKGLVNW